MLLRCSCQQYSSNQTLEMIMNRPIAITLYTAAVFGLALLPGSAFSQQKSLKDQLVGTWSLTAWEQTYKGGNKDQAFGAKPKGVQTFEPNGRFTLVFLSPDLPKVASNDRVKPSPDEAMAIAKGAIAYYGTYTVDEGSKTVTLDLEGTTFSNQIGVPQKRVVTAISADELKYQNPTSASGGVIEVAFKRLK
jgi:hypothetical protein